MNINFFRWPVLLGVRFGIRWNSVLKVSDNSRGLGFFHQYWANKFGYEI